MLKILQIFYIFTLAALFRDTISIKIKNKSNTIFTSRNFHYFFPDKDCIPYSFLFGIEAISKYMKKDTIILKKSHQEENISSPAIAIIPNWFNYSNPIIKEKCTFDAQFWDCVANDTFTHPPEEFIGNGLEVWNRKFDDQIGFFYTRNTSFKMTSTKAESYKLRLIIMFEPIYGLLTLPKIILHDKNSFFIRKYIKYTG